MLSIDINYCGFKTSILIGKCKTSIIAHTERQTVLIKFELASNRSSHQRCSVRKGALRNFTKFTWKHLCQSLFFNKVAGSDLWETLAQACNFIKKETLAQVFSCEFCKISKNTFLAEHLWATASSNLSLTKNSWHKT